MQFYSTKSRQLTASLEEAVFRSLPADNGLYMPASIPAIAPEFLEIIHTKSFNEIAIAVTHALLGSDLSLDEITGIVNQAFDFDAPVAKLAGDTYVLELFHGPSMAFKDFGARFMASLMSHFLLKSKKNIRILVATSGDTGGAVAQGFYKVPGVSVTILYPTGKVSAIQEKQLTTLGENITALEIDGTFDDCQRLVKEAFLDTGLNEQLNLASANSINIARLIPQAFYYFYAYAQLKNTGKDLVFSVPSGNFGNLSAGLLAYRMGLPVRHFVAATNQNNSVPLYLDSGTYVPKSSVETISNAMDVGHPSNFIRMTHLLDNDFAKISGLLSGYYFTDTETRDTMRTVYAASGYVLCPHTAVAYLGLDRYRRETGTDFTGVLLATAHPAKFAGLVDETLKTTIAIPERLEKLLSLDKKAEKLPVSYEKFKMWLLNSNAL